MEQVREYRSREITYQVLHRVMFGGAYSNLVLQGALDREKEPLLPEERRAITFLFYGVLRNFFLLDAIFRSKAHRGKLSVSPSLRLLAWMAIFELLYQKRIPRYATLSEYGKMALEKCSLHESKFLTACLGKVSTKDVEPLVRVAGSKAARMALEFSHPEWFVASVLKVYGEIECLKMLRTNNLGMPAYYRVNTTRFSVRELIELFDQTQRIILKTVHHLPGCVYFKVGETYYPRREYEGGWLTPQDFSTQIVAHAVAPRPGESVLDLCCGRGTKATHLAELMKNTGSVTACDKFEHKIDLLKADAQRLGLSIIEPHVADVTARPDLGLFDRVLLDAPCSGTGTFRRRPEIKQRLRPEDIGQLMDLQKELLDAAASYVRPGGRLVYSTCSVLPEENDDIAGRFLEKHTEFSSVAEPVEISRIPGQRTPFGKVFLSHQTQACASAVYVMNKRG